MLFAFFLTFLVGLGGVTWAPPAFWGDVLTHTPLAQPLCWLEVTLLPSTQPVLQDRPRSLPWGLSPQEWQYL